MYRSSDMGSSVPLNRACRREEHGVGPDFTVRPDAVSEFTVHSHSPHSIDRKRGTYPALVGIFSRCFPVPASFCAPVAILRCSCVAVAIVATGIAVNPAPVLHGDRRNARADNVTPIRAEDGLTMPNANVAIARAMRHKATRK